MGSAETVGADRTVIFQPHHRDPQARRSNPPLPDRALGDGLCDQDARRPRPLTRHSLTPAATIVSHPSAPQTLSVVARAAGGVTATWTAPASDGGDAVDSYRVEWDLGAGTFGNATVITGSLTADITAVDQGDDVSVRVSATNEAGTGPSSTIATATAPSAPDPVESVTADATVAARQVDLSWVTPDANGSAITGYDIQYKLDTQGWEDATTAGSSPPLTTSASITGLNAALTGEFRVRAVNRVDAGDYSTAVSATPADIPATPANLTVESFGDSEGRPQLDAANENGSAITALRIPTLTTETDSAPPSPPEHPPPPTVTGLTNGTAYDFQIRAVNAIGDSAWSDSITETPPPHPQHRRTSPSTASAIARSPSAGTPQTENGSAITRYEYRLDDETDSAPPSPPEHPPPPPSPASPTARPTTFSNPSRQRHRRQRLVGQHHRNSPHHTRSTHGSRRHRRRRADQRGLDRPGKTHRRFTDYAVRRSVSNRHRRLDRGHRLHGERSDHRTRCSHYVRS